MIKYNTFFYISSTDNLNVLEGSIRLLLNDTYFIAPKVKTNIYKGIIPTFKNRLSLEIHQYNNNGFILTETKETKNAMYFILTYGNEFIEFELKIDNGIIVQREIFSFKLPILSKYKLINNIKNKHFDFRFYNEETGVIYKKHSVIQHFCKSIIK